MKGLIIGISVAAVVIMIFLCFLFYSIGSKTAEKYQNENVSLKDQLAGYDMMIQGKNYKIDSLSLEISRYHAANVILGEKIDILKKQKIVKIVNYSKLKADERATQFLLHTQENQLIGLPSFVNDSLLVPMNNIDRAMAIIYEEQYCDTVLTIKDMVIDNKQAEITKLEQIVDLERDKYSILETENKILIVRDEKSNEYIKSLEKKLKWKKFIGTVKDVVIVAGTIYILI